jgi:hypothetical protein
MEIISDIAADPARSPSPVAEMIAENLHNYSLGCAHKYSKDVARLTRARAMAEVLEDRLVGVREGPIPLDPAGKAADALGHALRLAGPASWECHQRARPPAQDAAA